MLQDEAPVRCPEFPSSRSGRSPCRPRWQRLAIAFRRSENMSHWSWGHTAFACLSGDPSILDSRTRPVCMEGRKRTRARNRRFRSPRPGNACPFRKATGKIRTGSGFGRIETKSMEFPLGRGSLQRERAIAGLVKMEETEFAIAGNYARREFAALNRVEA